MDIEKIKQELLAFKTNVDCDDVKVKEQIKKILVHNEKIIFALNNKELQAYEAEPDEYFNVNILPYYMINPTQHNVQNFLCYEVSYRDVDRYNAAVKELQIVFHILCENKNIIEENTGIARHDLLAALVQDQFNHSNYFGNKIELISDQPATVDKDYAARTLIFQQRTDNNMVRTINGTTRLTNKDIRTL